MAEAAGYEIRACRSAAEFRSTRAAEQIDLLLLDWQLPDVSGIEFTRELRSRERKPLPVVFVTGEHGEERVVAALEAGADDYLVKPMGQAELRARLQALIRRSYPASTEVLICPPYRLDWRDGSVRVCARQFRATPKEFEFLAFLFSRPGEVCSRSAVLARVWRKPSAVPTRTIDTHASRLKKKYELDGRHGWLVEGVYQRGYRLRQVPLDDPLAGSGASGLPTRPIRGA